MISTRSYREFDGIKGGKATLKIRWDEPSENSPEMEFRRKLLIWESELSKPLSKREKKQLRWARIMDPDWKGFEIQLDKGLHGKEKFGDWLISTIKGLLIQSKANGEIFDYSSVSLRNVLDEMQYSMPNMINGEALSPNHFLIWCLGIGGCFGETIIRNLGGKWQFPNRMDLEIARIRNKPERLVDHYFVVQGKNRIPVMKIARWRYDGNGRVKSLYEIYEKIRTTGDWK